MENLEKFVYEKVKEAMMKALNAEGDEEYVKGTFDIIDIKKEEDYILAKISIHAELSDDGIEKLLKSFDKAKFVDECEGGYLVREYRIENGKLVVDEDWDFDSCCHYLYVKIKYK